MLLVFQAHGWQGSWIAQATVGASVAYTSISASLNILLTLMIVIRLVFRGRSMRATTGSSAGLSGLYKIMAAMFIESSALYAGTSVLTIGLWATKSGVSNAFAPVVCIIQVCASRSRDPPEGRLDLKLWRI